MAGLNDDVDEGLPSLEELAELEKTISNIHEEPNVNSNQPQPEKIILIANDLNQEPKSVIEPSVNELFGDEIIPGEVPNLNAEFEIIEQRRNALDDFKSVALNIEEKKSVCQEDIKLLDSISPGFINDERPIGYFTKLPTKTYFEETIRDMNLHISKESISLESLKK